MITVQHIQKLLTNYFQTHEGFEKVFIIEGSTHNGKKCAIFGIEFLTDIKFSTSCIIDESSNSLEIQTTVAVVSKTPIGTIDTNYINTLIENLLKLELL